MWTMRPGACANANAATGAREAWAVFGSHEEVSLRCVLFHF